MPHLVVKLMLQLVERNKVFDLVFHGRVASPSGNGHVIAQVNQPLKSAIHILRVVQRQYNVEDFLSSHLVHFSTCIVKFGKEMQEGVSRAAVAFYMIRG